MATLDALLGRDLEWHPGFLLGEHADDVPGDFTIIGLGAVPLAVTEDGYTNVLNEPLTHTLDAAIARGYMNDFYFRVHLFPRVLNLGNLLNTQVREVEVFNAYFTAENLTSITPTGADGLELTEPVVLPYELAGLNSLVYELTVTTDGPGTINASFLFDFDSEDLTLVVTGIRVVVFDFSPDWSQAVSDILQWKTRIITSFNGSEQRAALLGYQHPRRELAYALQLSGPAEAAKFEAMLWGFGNRAFALPIWCDQALLSAPVTAGATSIELDTETFSFYDGGILIIRADDGSYETVEIESVEPSQVLLARGAQQSWPAGTRVFPINTGRLPPSVEVTRVTDQVSRAAVQFSIEPIGTDPYVAGGAAAATYDGKEVLLIKPNWLQEPSHASSFPYLTLDSGYGARAYFMTRPNPDFTYRYRHTFETRAEQWFFRQFLGRCDGRRVAFWMPTWFSDFTVAQQVLSGATQMLCHNNGYSQFVEMNAHRRHVFIEIADGQTFMRRIEGASFDPETGLQQIAIDSPLGVTVAPEEFLKVSFLGKFRLAEDRVSIDWQTTAVAYVDLRVELISA